MTRQLLALDGDGIGPEIMAATLAVLDAARLRTPIRVTRADIGFAALETSGSTIPDDVIAAAKAADGVLLGPVSHNAYPPREDGGLNPSGVLRRELELYANIRPARRMDGVPAPANGPVDLIVVRENLEGFYADRNMHAGVGEVMPVPGVALATRKITADGSRRIAEAAFRLAADRPDKHVTAVHKANVMRLSDGLFLDCVRDVAQGYPDVTYDEVLVDAAAAHLVRDASRFDVIVTTNMFGDILSDLASELAGGLGLAASLNVGPHHAAAQAQHGSAPDIAGQNRANPVSLILSLAMLLRHMNEDGAATAIEGTVADLLKDPSTRTPDLGGTMGTREFGAAVAARMETPT
ncbi:isocitrate/isopropylmalate dehydrogenase family protein [Pseudaestuariivita atlantica]|uniref:3-isopropylmalate dehydrogenase n=1 Tax=Pseudaestuariivita atlantica TaxID=1317121 RepID=A0A0L1JPB2_9RHOB|nr:isocitrate/isopropylmalate dehydrogenase family protein [Pseudaestuariivita atlantica]KNG93253.1 3-isopropylmalate dehydrogenase [Pseudaestuariivita atlantica]